MCGVRITATYVVFKVSLIRILSFYHNEQAVNTDTTSRRKQRFLEFRLGRGGARGGVRQ
jgi:hypothetical protein